MNKKVGIVLGVLIVAVVILVAMGIFKNDEKKSLEADIVGFAQCLKDEGAVFYGAFWCPHCQNQKRMFGREASKSLPYVECSTPDGQGQTEACKEAGVESYPTWHFADGSKSTGEKSIQELSRQTSCPISPAMMEFYKVEETEATIEALQAEVETLQTQVVSQQ